MTKKDFKVFAEIVSYISDDKERNMVMDRVVQMCMSVNDRFDEDRFREYVKRLKNGEDLKGLR